MSTAGLSGGQGGRARRTCEKPLPAANRLPGVLCGAVKSQMGDMERGRGCRALEGPEGRQVPLVKLQP